MLKGGVSNGKGRMELEAISRKNLMSKKLSLVEKFDYKCKKKTNLLSYVPKVLAYRKNHPDLLLNTERRYKKKKNKRYAVGMLMFKKY